LAAAGRYRLASARLLSEMELADAMEAGRYAADAQNGKVAATVALAKVKAETGDQAAISFADKAADRLANSKPRLDQLWAYAVMHGELGGVYRRMGAVQK